MSDEKWIEFLTQEEKQMIPTLKAWMTGRDLWGNRLKNVAFENDPQAAAKEMQAQSAAAQQYQELMNRAIERSYSFDRAEQEKEKHEQSMVKEEALLQLEAERIQIEKAKVVVQALEVAAKAGVPADKLLEAIQSFNQQLLPALPDSSGRKLLKG